MLINSNEAREMPKIKRTRKLVITEEQAVGSPQGRDVVASVDEGKFCILHNVIA